MKKIPKQNNLRSKACLLISDSFTENGNQAKFQGIQDCKQPDTDFPQNPPQKRF